MEEICVDFDDINRHIEDLAKNELNGRQIRNAITTARQFSRYQEKELDYAILRQVIKIALKLDKQTTEMHGGMSDDARKREDTIRPRSVELSHPLLCAFRIQQQLDTLD